MNVSAIIVTRGDVELGEILESLPDEWEKIVWDNGAKKVDVYNGSWKRRYQGGIVKETWPGDDLAVYGRYAAIQVATHKLIYVQDDDVLHTTDGVEQIVGEWLRVGRYPWDGRPADDAWGNDPRDGLDHIVCNMPANFRARHFYDEHSLVGFGACFHRDAPEEAFASFWTGVTLGTIPAVATDDFNRTCDIVFTALTPRVLVDVPYEDMPWASADNRMWKQPWHQGIRDEMLDLVLKVKGAT